MALRIVEIHKANSPKELNTEWFVVENQGDKPFSTRNCVLSTSRPGSKKRTDLGTIDPGFVLAPGDKVRVLTGKAGRKVHGKPPSGDIPNYNLFLNEPALRGPGTALVLSLRSRVMASATFDPEATSGVASNDG